MRRIFALFLIVAVATDATTAIALTYTDPQIQLVSTDKQYGPYSSTGLNRPILPDSGGDAQF